MRRMILPLALLCASICFGQNSNKDIDETHREVQKTLTNLDSLNKQVESSMNSYYNKMDSAETKRSLDNNIQNLNTLMQSMEEQKEKQRRAAYWRIGIGVTMLTLGLIAIFRKKKQKAA